VMGGQFATGQNMNDVWRYTPGGVGWEQISPAVTANYSGIGEEGYPLGRELGAVCSGSFGLVWMYGGIDNRRMSAFFLLFLRMFYSFYLFLLFQ
jgi:hypothetical protein